MKQFLDDVQQKCWDWPVMALRWKAGAGFATGAHLASGKSATIQALHTFFLSVQMVVVANEPPATCLLGACATNRNESAPVPVYTAEEKADAASLAKRLAVPGKKGREATGWAAGWPSSPDGLPDFCGAEIPDGQLLLEHFCDLREHPLLGIKPT